MNCPWKRVSFLFLIIYICSVSPLLFYWLDFKWFSFAEESYQIEDCTMHMVPSLYNDFNQIWHVMILWSSFRVMLILTGISLELVLRWCHIVNQISLIKSQGQFRWGKEAVTSLRIARCFYHYPLPSLNAESAIMVVSFHSCWNKHFFFKASFCHFDSALLLFSEIPRNYSVNVNS